MGNERVEVAGIAIAPAPPIAPIGPSEQPGAPEGDVSPSGGVTLQQRDTKDTKDTLTMQTTRETWHLINAGASSHAHAFLYIYMWHKLRDRHGNVAAVFRFLPVP